jgi:hypothetical protein
MLAPHFAAVLSLLPAALFSIAMVANFSVRSPDRELLAGLGLGDRARKLLELLLVIATVFLVFPTFRTAGVVLASGTLVVLATAMLIHSKYDYAVPMLIAIASLPLALPGPQ